ncbi:hypothetical protein Sipo8835_25035 [Streptomyces ipomoeae]|jgi:hypothetical protein|uniref:Uncharacterized protein n=2 Tax=Streptomyces ipomoeae TaxID=103232 RepID=L1KZ15_9ACTN|nr:hypothetical protein [Streptomyces ipomoeae]EKX66071.1 hypothetical protein STRIP9103_06838 [Streptomyces ipomoeae 91-03]MDX2700024.1 hypothetical protein [Streptomyces ipomoeae]MDX2827298.1 hypothetical protein [Streptomyces ipomoeae]MDX2846028.1 hypothetical protein [Streptomyces ipomoeae]MDX2880359.1 hypothetical protein [Streptomyces ipomoeae]
MSARPNRPAARWPAAEWWAPLVTDLAAIQRGSAGLGLVVRRISLVEATPYVEVAWPDGAEVALSPEPEAGVPALLETFSVAGPVSPPPADHEHTHWAPGSDAPPLLKYAWLLDELGSESEAWYAYVPARVELLEIRTDGVETVDIGVGRPELRGAMRVRVSLARYGEAAGIGYAVVERAVAMESWETPSAGPTEEEPIGGLPTGLVPLVP